MDVKIVKNGVNYYRLYCKCPVCIERGIVTEPVYWQHKYSIDCGGDMFIGENAMLLCERDAETIPLIQSEFICPHHSQSDGNYIRRRYDNYKIEPEVVMALLSQLPVGLPFLQRLIQSLQDY